MGGLSLGGQVSMLSKSLETALAAQILRAWKRLISYNGDYEL